MAIRVINADDHPMLRKGVTDLMIQTADIEWVGSAADGKEAIEKIQLLKPDVAILDIEMPYFNGIEVAQQLIKENTLTKFILLTLFKDESFLKNALKAGIHGYLLKDSSENEIITAIRSVYEGRPYISAALTSVLVVNNKDNDLLNQLSSQEINILKLVAKQKTTAEIADMLFISVKTVANHRSNISKKLQLSGEQNGLLKWAIEHKDKL